MKYTIDTSYNPGAGIYSVTIDNDIDRLFGSMADALMFIEEHNSQQLSASAVPAPSSTPQ